MKNKSYKKKMNEIKWDKSSSLPAPKLHTLHIHYEEQKKTNQTKPNRRTTTTIIITIEYMRNNPWITGVYATSKIITKKFCENYVYKSKMGYLYCNDEKSTSQKRA